MPPHHRLPLDKQIAFLFDIALLKRALAAARNRQTPSAAARVRKPSLAAAPVRDLPSEQELQTIADWLNGSLRRLIAGANRQDKAVESITEALDKIEKGDLSRVAPFMKDLTKLGISTWLAMADDPISKTKYWDDPVVLAICDALRHWDFQAQAKWMPPIPKRSTPATIRKAARLAAVPYHHALKQAAKSEKTRQNRGFPFASDLMDAYHQLTGRSLRFSRSVAPRTAPDEGNLVPSGPLLRFMLSIYADLRQGIEELNRPGFREKMHARAPIRSPHHSSQPIDLPAEFLNPTENTVTDYIRERLRRDKGKGRRERLAKT